MRRAPTYIEHTDVYSRNRSSSEEDLAPSTEELEVRRRQSII